MEQYGGGATAQEYTSNGKIGRVKKRNIKSDTDEKEMIMEFKYLGCNGMRGE